MRKNLLIGSIVNYDWDNVAPFFNSYMQAGFENCECIIFTSNIPASTIEKIRQFNIQIQQIPERFLHRFINDYRWELYVDFLRDKVEDYDIIFTSDVRDVIFQADVFKFYDANKPFLGLAHEHVDLTNQCNKDWLLRRYGKDIYESLKFNQTICAGTIWGTSRVFFEFAQHMANHINSTDFPFFKYCDQVVCNYLIYHEKLFENIIITSNNYNGRVMTIGETPNDGIKHDLEGRLLNGEGKIAAVFHQYDRKTEEVKAVLKKYSAGMSLLGKAILRNPSNTLRGRILRFLKKCRRYGLIYSFSCAIKRRFIKQE